MPATRGVENKSDLVAAPGEVGVYGEKFAVSPILPHLKAQLMCSTTRFVYKSPNTLLGLIPLGANESTVPLKSISTVQTSSKFYVGRVLLGIILLIAGLSNFQNSFLVGLVLLALAVTLFLVAYPAALDIQTHSGAVSRLTVSSLEKAKLGEFTKVLQGYIFADHDQMRHDEAQQVRTQQALLQQMMLQQQMMSNPIQNQSWQAQNQSFDPSINLQSAQVEGQLPDALEGGHGPGFLPTTSESISEKPQSA